MLVDHRDPPQPWPLYYLCISWLFVRQAEWPKSWLGHPYMIGIICPLPPVWNRVKVDARSWLGRIPNVLLCSVGPVCWGNSYVQMNANYLFSKKKSSTTCHCIHTCLESLGIFQAYTLSVKRERICFQHSALLFKISNIIFYFISIST